MDWAVVVIGSSLFAVSMFYSRLHRHRRHLLLEFRSHNLIAQNQQLKIKAIEQELSLAQKISESFAPPTQIEDKRGFSVSFYQSRYDALGGDWLASRYLPSGELAILVVDATGKGIQAALVIHAVQSLWAHAFEQAFFNPISWIASLNKTLCALGQRSPHTMTLGLVIMSPAKLCYYSAGHIPLFIIGRSKDNLNTVIPVLSGGSILGISEVISLTPVTVDLVKLNPQAILLGTDGVFDKPTLINRHDILALHEGILTYGSAVLDNIATKDDKMLAYVNFTGYDSVARCVTKPTKRAKIFA